MTSTKARNWCRLRVIARNKFYTMYVDLSNDQCKSVLPVWQVTESEGMDRVEMSAIMAGLSIAGLARQFVFEI